MAKELITADNVAQFVRDGKLCMDKDKILTPGARDVLSQKHIEIVYCDTQASSAAYGMVGQPCCHQNVAAGNVAGAGQACAPQHDGTACKSCDYDEDTLVGVAAIIRRHYNITDPDELRRVTLTTVRAIMNGQK